MSLATAIVSYKHQNSLAIALYGGWGSGKSSVINMTLEHISVISTSPIPENKPIVMRFNPWNFSDQNQLISQFFKQLSGTLRRTDYAASTKKIGELLDAYATLLEPLVLVPWAGAFVKGIKLVGGAAKNWGDKKSNDIDSTRDELNRLLERQERKIIIVIDDIDRLNNIGPRQIFQLVKSLGDFPNTIYMLAFDKNVVINALSKVQEGSGTEYLEKIVQVPFEIPLVSKQRVEQLLFSQLGQMIEALQEERWNQAYWIDTYYGGLRYLFSSIRDVTITNALVNVA